MGLVPDPKSVLNTDDMLGRLADGTGVSTGLTEHAHSTQLIMGQVFSSGDAQIRWPRSCEKLLLLACVG